MGEFAPPHDDNPIMQGAWLAFVKWAYDVPGIRQQFLDDTGFDLDRIDHARGIEKMVDDATGMTDRSIEAWVQWVTDNWWQPPTQ